MLRWILLATMMVAVGCSGAQPRPTGSVPPAPPPAEAAAPAPAEVSPQEVEAMVLAMAQSPFTVTWENDGFSYRAGLSRNGDRYYLPKEGQGAVQKGLRSWEVVVEGDGTMTWNGPHAGSIPQLPGLDALRAKPQLWGPGPFFAAVKGYRRGPLTENQEVWGAQLPAEGVKVELFFGPVRLRELRLWVEKYGNAYRPVRFAAKYVDKERSVELVGNYAWVEPAIPNDPSPPTKDQELGLFHIWLGETRDDIEPLRFVPALRTNDPDGSEWAVDDRARSVKYDPSSRVAIISQSRAGLINGLRIGDDAEAVERYLGPASEKRDSVFIYRFPFGSRLEVYLHDGKVTKFWAVAPGN